MNCRLLNIEAPIGEVCPSKQNLEQDKCYKGCGFYEDKDDLHKCDKVLLVRLRKDMGFNKTGNYGFCTINKNSIGALQPCCEKLCPLHLKVGGKDD